MNEKEFFVEGFSFVLRYMDKELLDAQQKGSAEAFTVEYKPKGFESEAQTKELMESFKEHFLREIYVLVNENREWYDRFEMGRSFNEGCRGSYNNLGRAGTIRAYRYLGMDVKQ